jgi:hypothetical protein
MNDDSMPEMADSGEDHRKPPLVGRSDHLIIAHRSAGLDGCGSPRFGCRDETVGEREKGIRATAEPWRSSPASPAFQTAIFELSTRDIWPAPIPSVRPSPA